MKEVLLGLLMAAIALGGLTITNELKKIAVELEAIRIVAVTRIPQPTPTRTPYPNNDPNDPICGDPVEFKKHFPANASPATNANTHKH